MPYELIRQLLKFSPRQLNNETKAGKYLISILRQNKVNFQLQRFSFYHPGFRKAELFADGKKINCQAISFVSGKIAGKNNLISSLSAAKRDFSFISFNPNCAAISASGRSISHPAVAISQLDLPKILAAKKVSGEVVVKKIKHQSQNILVGNLVNPKNLIFSHYDSINSGAVDNASGIAVSLKLILEHQELLKNNLFILSGNEELSYDFPVYWGFGYRVFEKKYFRLMKRAKKILVVDCVGNARPRSCTNAYWINEGFPVKNIKGLLTKIALIAGDLDKLMTVYHSNLDNLSAVNKTYLNLAYQYLLNLLK
jgi:hypothetical protein